MEGGLYLAALGLGLAGTPHCAVMCAAPCAALTRGGGLAAQVGFHAARALSYALAGALAAGLVNVLAVLRSSSPVLAPLWTLTHLAALLLGLWLVVYGRQPAWLEGLGRAPSHGAATRRKASKATGAALAGALWAAWPCGLLQSAILVAALGNTPWSGAGVMLCFAAASAAGILAAPWLWRRLGRLRGAAWAPHLGVRLAGAVLAGAMLWAMGRGAWSSIAAYCGF